MDQIQETIMLAVNGLLHMFSNGPVSHDEAISIAQTGIILAILLGLAAVFVGKRLGRAFGLALGALAVLAVIAALTVVFGNNILP